MHSGSYRAEKAPTSYRGDAVFIGFVAVSFLVAMLTPTLFGQDADDTFVRLEHGKLDESSGLAFSHRDANRFWTHNDSGGKARLFAFDRNGKHTGTCTLDDVKAIDWEDMASYVDEGPRLLAADCGDNQLRRKSIRLYLFDEPRPDQETTVKSFQTIEVKYPDGPRNCESVAVDARRRIIIMASKQKLSTEFYVVPLPEPDDGPKKIKAKASFVGEISLPVATGMDVVDRTGDIWITSYFHAFHLPQSERDVSLEKQLVPYPTPIELAKLKQIEAIAVDSLGQVWITSEGSPAKMAPVKRP